MFSEQVSKIRVPHFSCDGLIRTWRNVTGMTTQQLASRLGVKRQAVSMLEIREVQGSVRINTLRSVADAFGCDLVYAFVPKKGTVEDWVKQQAERKASKISEATKHSMLLEDQAVKSNRQLRELHKRLVQQYLEQLDSKLWD